MGLFDSAQGFVNQVYQIGSGAEYPARGASLPLVGAKASKLVLVNPAFSAMPPARGSNCLAPAQTRDSPVSVGNLPAISSPAPLLSA